MNRLFLAALCLSSAAAFADQTVTVDGNAAEWAAVTTCLPEVVGDGTNGVDLTRTCVENDNASGDLGSLHTLYQAAASFPTNADVYLGFALDLDGDGQITSQNDEVYAVVYPGPNSQWSGIQLAVYTPQNYSLKRTYSNPADCGGTGTSNGWAQARNGNTVELSVAYGCLREDATGTPPMQHCTDRRRFLMGAYPLFDLSSEMFYDGTANALYAPGAAPPVAGYPALTARSGQNRLFWSNPAEHEGTLIVRRTGAWGTGNRNFVPSNGTRYTAGQNINMGGGVSYRVVFANGRGCEESFTDTGLSDGTRYTYKVFNHNAGFTYASGNTPTASGIFGEPRAASATEPIWCYSTSATALQQPLPNQGVGVHTAGNGGALIGLVTSAGGDADGDELFRPVSLGGAIQARFPIVPLKGKSGKFIVTGTQNGRVAAVSSTTGAIEWSVPGSSFGGDFINAIPSVQLYDYSDAAFQAANPARDLVFVPTRIAGSSNYKVVALSSVNGSVVWQSAAMPPIPGGMMVDYPRNRLYVATASTASGSLRVLSTTSGAQLGAFSVGSVTHGVVKDFYWNQPVGQAIVVNDAGTAWGIDLGWTGTPPAPNWTVAVGAGPTSFPIPIPNGFLVSTRYVSSTDPGAVKRFSVTSTGATQVWSTPIQNPSGPWLHNAAGRIWVGSSDLKLHGLEFATGADSQQVSTGSSRPGTPGLDTTVNRLIAGLEDGRVCAFSIP